MSLSLDNINKIHFVGVGGVGMGGIAHIMLKQGFEVSGSDLNENNFVNGLRSNGADISIGHSKSNIKDPDVLVVSSAISESNPELIAAKEKGIPVVLRAQMLAALMAPRFGIAIAGTHGKTTTTGIVTSCLQEGEKPPTYVIGGVLQSTGKLAEWVDSDYFVAEADESDASFLHLSPKIAIVTNIDADHMGTYNSDFNTLKNTFIEFLHRLPKDGVAVMCGDDPVVREIIPKVERKVVTYGFSKHADVRVQSFEQRGLQTFFTLYDGAEFILNLPGRHNVLNALSAIIVARHLGVSDDAIKQALKKFRGLGRRFQILGEFKIENGSVTVIDDYGHHPCEVAATIDAMRAAWPDRRLVLAFQPHRYSRTLELKDDFIRVLANPDQLVLTQIYAAGETPLPEVDGKVLCDAVSEISKVPPYYCEDVNALPEQLPALLLDDDILIMQGAGNISSVAKKLVGV